MQVNVLIGLNFGWSQGKQVCSERNTLVPIFCPESLCELPSSL